MMVRPKAPWISISIFRRHMCCFLWMGLWKAVWTKRSLTEVRNGTFKPPSLIFRRSRTSLIPVQCWPMYRAQRQPGSRDTTIWKFMRRHWTFQLSRSRCSAMCVSRMTPQSTGSAISSPKKCATLSCHLSIEAGHATSRQIKRAGRSTQVYVSCASRRA